MRKAASRVVRERNNLWKLQNQNLKLLEGVTLRLAPKQNKPPSLASLERRSAAPQACGKAEVTVQLQPSQAQRRHHL